ncbi:MAG: helix-turn-helix domain-containing protein [bacterium]|nr:helix-turn-helix domain-containing protein [bacterium]
MTARWKLAKKAYYMAKKSWPAEEVAELTVGQIARKLNTHPSYLSRVFKGYYGITLKRFLQKRKYIAFSVLVRTRDIKTVKEALEILDIWSASHFIKGYKEFYHCTPAQKLREAKIYRREEERKRKESYERFMKRWKTG